MLRPSPLLRRLASLCVFALPFSGTGATAAGIDVDRASVASAIDRDRIVHSGALRLSEVLSSRAGSNRHGAYRRLMGGGESAVLLDGRLLSGWDPGTFPVALVERIEILDEGTARHTGSAASGALNIVTREWTDGWEVSLGGGTPAQDGGESGRASAAWAGALGEGRLTLGVERAGHQEVRDSQRAFSRARFRQGGALVDAVGVNAGGNTLQWTVDDATTGESRAVLAPLGECDPAVYAGVLTHPSGDLCAYAFADSKWQGFGGVGSDYLDRSRSSAFASGEHPLPSGWKAWWQARLAEEETLFRFAPSVGSFDLPLDDGLRTRLAGGSPGITDLSGVQDATIHHRNVAHGFREWRAEISERDLTAGVEGEVADGLRLDAHVRWWRQSLQEEAGAFVSEEGLRQAILAGDYDVLDPLSQGSDHLRALRATSLRRDREVVSETLSAQALLERAPPEGLRWTLGLEGERWLAKDVRLYTDPDGDPHPVEGVLGSGGNGFRGDRTRISGVAEAGVPVAPWWELTLTGRLDRHDDVGSAASWAAASLWDLPRGWQVRGGWSQGRAAPTLAQMHLLPSTVHPHVNDGGTTEQVESVLQGDPDLDVSRSERLSAGVSGLLSGLRVRLDWVSVEHEDLPSELDDQDVVDLHRAGRGPAGTEVVRTGGRITRIVNPIVQETGIKESALLFGLEGAWETPIGELGGELHVHRTLRSKQTGIVPKDLDFPRHRTHLRLGWTRDGLSVDWHVHGIEKHRRGTQGSWTGHDIVASWKGAFGVPGLDLSAGGLNLLDQGPPLMRTTGEPDPNLNPLNVPLDAVRGRTFFAEAAWAF